ncbi:UNVERIFIED_CONTAM: UDP-galactose transporter [Siphonaria sp. JEL0065]|nr:UDP-galactose transporter [Siphonaria sp. JEL0065]
MSTTLEKSLCVIGIYLCFFSWGILQERVTTTQYVDEETGEKRKFKYFIFLNVIQSILASLVAWAYLSGRGMKVQLPSVPLRNKLVQLSIISVCAAPFGYASLKYIDYPTMILGKSGKLVPVMLMNIILYRKSFPWQKYLVVLLITAGMAMFMLMNPKGSKKTDKNADIPLLQKLLGILLLCINLILDGVTNSTQDEIFRTFRTLSGFHMMFFMNVFSSIIMAVFLVVSDSYTQELSNAVAFATMHPQVLYDVVLFGLCGALGQCFIFHTIERFGAMFLVTVTVTRKMGSILISVFLYDHKLVLGQWCAVLLVFAGIAVESFAKGGKHRHGGEKQKADADIKKAAKADKMGLEKDNGVEVLDQKRVDGVRQRK